MKLPRFLSDSNVIISDTIVELLMKNNLNSTNSNTSTTIRVNTNYRGTDVETDNVQDMVVRSGVVPLLITHLRSESEEIREQSALCIGNIAGEMPELRDHVIKCGAIEPM